MNEHAAFVGMAALGRNQPSIRAASSAPTQNVAVDGVQGPLTERGGVLWHPLFPLAWPNIGSMVDVIS